MACSEALDLVHLFHRVSSSCTATCCNMESSALDEVNLTVVVDPSPLSPWWIDMRHVVQSQSS